jgi:hypothetical protein
MSSATYQMTRSMIFSILLAASVFAQTPALPPPRTTAAPSTSASTSVLSLVSLLDIHKLEPRKKTKMKVAYRETLQAHQRAAIFLTLENDGKTLIQLRFFDMPNNTNVVLWAVTTDRNVVRLAGITISPRDSQNRFQTETSLSDFGLFLTVEDRVDPDAPSGEIIAKVERV